MLDEIDDQTARSNIKSVLAGFCPELADDLGLSETLALEQLSRFIKIVDIDAGDGQITLEQTKFTADNIYMEAVFIFPSG